MKCKRLCFSFLMALLICATASQAWAAAPQDTQPASRLTRQGSIPVSERVQTNCFLFANEMFVMPGSTGDPELYFFEGVESPEFGSIEFDLNTGELLYIPPFENSEIEDVFNLHLTNPNSGNLVLEGVFSPETQMVSFSAPLMPVVKNEIVLIVDNGGPQIETYNLDGHDVGGVLDVIRLRIKGGAKVIGGYVRYKGNITYFGDKNIKNIFKIINPRVVEELNRNNAARSKEHGFLFGPNSEGLSAEERQILFDLGMVAADIGGIVDPTPICDGVACVGELSQGNFVYASINVVAMIPWLGDLAKAGKAPKLIRIVKNAIAYAVKNPKFAARIKPLLEVLSNALGRLPDGVAKVFGDLKSKVDDFLATLAPKSPLEAAMGRGMKILRGPTAPDEMVGVLEKLGKPMSRNKIREVIHDVKRKMNIGAAEDLIFDRSGGLWDSRTGEYIGKIWEAF